MKKPVSTVILILSLCMSPRAHAFQQPDAIGYPAKLPDAKEEVYKKIGELELKIFRYEPEGHSSDLPRPAIVFFFGGGWASGSPAQFQMQAKYLASRGMVALLADYRVASRHQVRAVSCVEDAKSAIRWVRLHASRLGIDPSRIVASGGSAGGHLAACTALIEQFDLASEDSSVSSAPNALVLFNPALVLAASGESELADAFKPETIRNLSSRLGVDPETLSPYHHCRKLPVPTIIFHGKADDTVPYVTAQAFCKKMTEMGNRCELIGYDNQPHGFFNFNRKDKVAFYDTLLRSDQFLISLNYLSGQPKVSDLKARGP